MVCANDDDDGATSGWGTTLVVVVLLLLALLESRIGEERKLETRSSYSSGIAAVLEEDAVVVVAAGSFDCRTSRLKFSQLEDGANREGISLLLLICAWLRTDEVLAGCTGAPDGVFEGTAAGIRMRRSEAPGSIFIFTGRAVALGKAGVYGEFLVAAGERSKG